MKLWVAFGSLMYVLGLFSCATLVWIMTRIPKANGPINMNQVQVEYAKHQEAERLRVETKLCIQRYCATG
jgi:hypothetical protein